MPALRGLHLTRRTPICGIAASQLAAAALLLAIGACATNPVRQGPCGGSRVLVVQNNTRGDVDVVAVEGGIEKMLGIASPGRREFSLSDVSERARFIAKRDGTYLQTMAANGAAGRVVEFNVACR